MKYKTRIICPICNNGFIVNPKETEHIHFVGDSYPRIINHPPSCNVCNRPFNITFNFETFEIEIESNY